MALRRVCLDLDGVLHHPVTPFKADWIIPDRPVKGAVDKCWEAYNDNVELMVYSGRCRSPEALPAIENWLDLHGFPPMQVCSSKPHGVVLIDDNGYRFTGDWSETDLFEIGSARSWLGGGW